MLNRKITIPMILVIVLLSALIFFYLKYWRQPQARYVQTQNPKLAQIRQDLNELKADLVRQGLYACCIKEDCNWCALYMGHCPCAELVSTEGAEMSCPECAAAWNRKQGKIYGVDADAIQVSTFGVYGYERQAPHSHAEKGSGESGQGHH